MYKRSLGQTDSGQLMVSISLLCFRMLLEEAHVTYWECSQSSHANFRSKAKKICVLSSCPSEWNSKYHRRATYEVIHLIAMFGCKYILNWMFKVSS